MTADTDYPGFRPDGAPALCRRSFIGHFLDADGALPHPLSGISEAAGYLQALSLADLGGRPLQPGIDDDEGIAGLMAAETIVALGRSHRGSSGWYRESIERTLAIAALLRPELADDRIARKTWPSRFRDAMEARTILVAAMAITSQNVSVRSNMRFAMEQYVAFGASGRFDPRPYGTKGEAIRLNLERFNLLLDIVGGDIGRIRRFLDARFTMSEFRSIAASSGIEIGGKEFADEIVHGSMIFGPKIGNGFMQNLLGNFDTLTIDMWFMRTWGRYTGTLLRGKVIPGAMDRLIAGVRRSSRRSGIQDILDGAKVRNPGALRELAPSELLGVARAMHRLWERARRDFVRRGGTNEAASEFKARLLWPGAAESIVKSLGMPVDAPGSARERRWIRRVVDKALHLVRARGFDVTAADMQAVLWYPEKELYDRLTGNPAGRFNVSYDVATIELVREQGFHDDDIADALHRAGLEWGVRGGSDLASPGGGAEGEAGAIHPAAGDGRRGGDRAGVDAIASPLSLS